MGIIYWCWHITIKPNMISHLGKQHWCFHMLKVHLIISSQQKYGKLKFYKHPNNQSGVCKAMQK